MAKSEDQQQNDEKPQPENPSGDKVSGDERVREAREKSKELGLEPQSPKPKSV